MIIAIAALILVAVVAFGQTVMDWMGEKWRDLRGESISPPT